jgi:hypothetical protein
LEAFPTQRFRGEAAKITTEITKPEPKKSLVTLRKQITKQQWRPKQLRSEVATTSTNVVPEHAPLEPKVTIGEPTPEVSLVSADSPKEPLVLASEIKDTFEVELVRQQMSLNDDQDIPVDEPGLELEPEDDFDEENSLHELDNDASDSPECGMVYVLSAKYALPSSVAACQAVDVEGDDDAQLIPKEEEVSPQIEIDSALKKLFMMFSKPNLAMSMHLRPLYATVTLEDKEINKMMVDSGAAVNVITVRTMTILGIKKSAIQQTTLSVKNFAGTTTQTLGLLFLKVKLGPADAVHAFFVIECTAPYSGILGRDWIHRSYCIPSSMHQELLLWNPVTDEADLFKADPRPFSVSANSIDASYYNGDMRPLAVQDIDTKGRPFGVTAFDLAQWGLVQTKTDSSRPYHVVPQSQRS